MNSLDLSRSGVKAGISCGALAGIDSYNGYKVEAMRIAYQGGASLFAGSIENMVRPMLPEGAQISSMLLQPLLVAGTFTLVCKFMLKDKMYKYNMLASLGAEMTANWTTPMLNGLLNPSNVSAGQYMAGAISKPSRPAVYSASY